MPSPPASSDIEINGRIVNLSQPHLRPSEARFRTTATSCCWMSVMAHLRLWLMGLLLAAATSYGATLQKDMVGVSVVVPCYNHGSTLKRALDSIVVSARHLQGWLEARGEPKHSVQVEIVVVDDNSTDSTARVAAQFKKQSDLPLKVKVRRHEWGEQHAGPDPR
ncbi:hypothetical protein CYMTET_42448, partial [Cymbomonas tetramitiformis]